MKNNIHIITNIAPSYRLRLWKVLLDNDTNDYKFYFSKKHPLNIESIDFDKPLFKNLTSKLFDIKGVWIKNKILVWQKGILSKCLSFSKQDVVIYFGDLYCLSTWFSSLILRLKGVRLVYWSHGLYGNESGIKKIIRKLFFNLPNYHLLYERRAKKIMTENGFDKNKLYVFFNSLDYNLQKELFLKSSNYSKKKEYSFFSNPQLPCLIFIGRLTKKKNLDLLVKAAQTINAKETITNLLFVGDGEYANSLMDLGKKGIDQKWIHFAGACYDEIQISKYLSLSNLCVSPGNIGLTAIHSLSYGTPVCTQNNFNDQMPEAEAIEEGVNGVFFQQGNIDSLVNKIIWSLEHLPKDQLTQSNCRKIIDQYYNPNYQVEVLEDIISMNLPRV